MGHIILDASLQSWSWTQDGLLWIKNMHLTIKGLIPCSYQKSKNYVTNCFKVIYSVLASFLAFTCPIGAAAIWGQAVSRISFRPPSSS